MNQQLLDDIMKKLKIDGGMFIQMEIEEYIKDIDSSKHLEFFKALSGGDFDYKNPMDRIAMTAKKFKQEKTDNLLAGTRDQAKEMYDKFYNECCAMLDYCRDNRDKHPHDREFFEAVDFAKLKKKDGTDAYTKQELYVLGELGGGSWLIDIRFYDNSKVVIDKIEKIIKDAITTKYNQQEAINHNVKKMLKK